MHCHHEKLVIVDGKIGYVGGIDLTSLGGDRFDSGDHPARGKIGWHDASSRLEGPAVADHFASRWQEVTGEELAATSPPPRAGDHEVQVIHTDLDAGSGAAPRSPPGPCSRRTWLARIRSSSSSPGLRG
jgi:phosphatidylserine/phosphatidylglycerophosphate/cardiolipin synthase-like enzyme